MSDKLTPDQLGYFTDDLAEWGVANADGDVEVYIDHQPDGGGAPCLAVVTADARSSAFITHLLAVATAGREGIDAVTEQMSVLGGLQQSAPFGTGTIIYWPTITA
jgi:hypothetical protein